MIKNAKNAALFFVLIFALVSLFSCGKERCEHRLVHIDKREPTCRADGAEEYYLCLGCDRIFSDGEGRNEIFSPVTVKSSHVQTYVPAVKASCDTDGTDAYYECSCGKLYSDKAITKEIAEPSKIKSSHAFDGDGECTVCGAFKPCEHLVYLKSADGSSYKVVGYTASSERRIVVPETYDGLPVTEISASAFFGKDKVEQIILPSGIKTIGKSAFDGCTSLKSVTLGSGLLTVEERAFYGCSSLTEISLGSSLTSIGKEAFYGCSSLNTVQLGISLKRIGERVFFGCTALARIDFPTTLSRIGGEAFGGCVRLGNVYFGSADGWCYYGSSSYRDFKGEIAKADLNSPNGAARLLTGNLCGYFWIRDVLVG